ncbi:hypothetical protein NIM87_16010 [Devosia sp. XJ19-1]|uniref:Uncharacterized protein n=1 Tax=Devosia ureilytica TaxID=2952754 RepID=A0A9Q4FUC7_9HYPH|nr:hypothetical protein [Devosia ureilytica]MCP8885015.1 hypothetical protein [Devosia ureilytica]MCP8888474.1 hypothetical protein [Devosia ureilytica]
MNLPTRHMLMGMTLGAVCATTIAAIGPGFVLQAIADEMPAGFDTDKLVKFEGRDYEVDYADWVSTDPLSSATVKKIEGGRVSYVSISTTATGTYSTDGLTSKHVLYPGVDVTEVAPNRANWMRFWSNGSWFNFSSRSGNSVLRLTGRTVGY